MNFPDLHDWQFKAAQIQCKIGGPDTPPPEAEIGGGLVCYSAGKHYLVSENFDKMDMVVSEEVLWFCSQLGVDPLDFYIAAKSAKPPRK